MDMRSLATNFMTAATALKNELIDYGTIGKNLRAASISINGKKFLVFDQNPDRESQAARLAKEGHDIVVVKDVDANQLIGYADLTEGKFTRFQPVGEPIPIEQIERAVASAGIKTEAQPTSGMSNWFKSGDNTPSNGAAATR